MGRVGVEHSVIVNSPVVKHGNAYPVIPLVVHKESDGMRNDEVFPQDKEVTDRIGCQLLLSMQS